MLYSLSIYIGVHAFLLYLNLILQDPKFGVLFDIDGVLTRGKNVIPAAKKAMKKITDSNGEFIVPTVFVTNAGNTLRKYKAEALSKLFDINVCMLF